MVRVKYRYFAVEIQAMGRPEHAPLEISKRWIFTAVMRKIQEIHGDFGVASVTNGFNTKYCNPYTKIALIRCRHGSHRFVATVLPLIKDIYRIPVRFKIIHVGATMSKCYKYVVRYQQRCVEKFWNKMKTDADRIKMKEAFSQVALHLSSE